MEVKAKVKNIRISPKKVRLVVDLVRGKKVDNALTQLTFLNKRAAKPVRKLLESAVANAQNNNNLDQKDLFIKAITVDEAMTYKRWMPRAYGRATPLRKRGSHINVVLGLVEGAKVAKVTDSKPKSQQKKAVKQEKTTVKKSAKNNSNNEKVDIKEHKSEPFDRTRQGKNRHNQSQDQAAKKEKGGTVRKVYNKKKES